MHRAFSAYQSTVYISHWQRIFIDVDHPPPPFVVRGLILDVSYPATSVYSALMNTLTPCIRYSKFVTEYPDQL